MSSTIQNNYSESYWFVGANHGANGDQTERFIREGIWETKDASQPLEKVKTIAIGAPIAIKSTFTRKNDLPFDNKGHHVSAMRIKAVGVVTENPGDGIHLKVDWSSVEPPREWYFFTDRSALWQIRPHTLIRRALIDFVFKGKDQDLDYFRNEPYWRVRFGDKAAETKRFAWTRFYEEFANKLLRYRDRRDELITAIHAISAQLDCMSVLNDQYEKGATGEPLRDICPFTVMALFNRNLTEQNKRKIAFALAEFLEISTADIPVDFAGIPAVNNLRTWFFGYHYERSPDDIDVLWEMFSRAIARADSQDDEYDEQAFMDAYNDAERRPYVGWNLTIGLYWVRPWHFQSLDGRSRDYIEGELGLKINKKSSKYRCTAEDYLMLLKTLEERFEDSNFPVHSFPELTLTPEPNPLGSSATPADLLADGGKRITPANEPALAPYTIDDITEDGAFLEPKTIEKILARIQAKKNLILQGPPGTGKTWLAKRLAFVLVGQRDKKRVRAIQFHPNLSYEDFIRGWRPSGEGKLTLVDGPFMEMIKRAKADRDSNYVVVIEEINRGNPAHIFGEMLTLLEADKRSADEALELTYRRGEDERVFVPENLHVIGTMNIADRSLALVDLALRRRFAFIDLQPTFGERWRNWVQKYGVDPATCARIEARITALNTTLANDMSLGSQFEVGHSYVTPTTRVEDGQAWFRQVVETEIGPLLDEYWFDNASESKKARQTLLEGFGA